MKGHGFAVGEIIHGERRRGDGVVIQWKLALIDGGLVNNIPADVLVSMGCNFVIAISVTADAATTVHSRRRTK